MASGDLRSTARKKPTGKKTKELSQEEQSKRFIETARTLDLGQSSEAFERALDKILPAKKAAT